MALTLTLTHAFASDNLWVVEGNASTTGYLSVWLASKPNCPEVRVRVNPNPKP